VTVDFVIKGGDGYTVLKEHNEKWYRISKYIINKVVRYFKQLLKKVLS